MKFPHPINLLDSSVANRVFSAYAFNPVGKKFGHDQIRLNERLETIFTSQDTLFLYVYQEVEASLLLDSLSKKIVT